MLIWLPLPDFGWNTGRSGALHLGLVDFGVFKRRLELVLLFRVLLALHFELEKSLLISDHDVIDILGSEHMEGVLTSLGKSKVISEARGPSLQFLYTKDDESLQQTRPHRLGVVLEKIRDFPA